MSRTATPSDHPSVLPAEGEDVVVDALGTPIALRVEARFAGRLRAQWARCLTTGPGHVLDLRGHHDDHTREYVAAWRATVLALTRLLEGSGNAVGPSWVSLHAAGLADSSGSVLALVGPSGSGKTTAAAELGKRLGYVTDECVTIDRASLAVLSYPKPLSVVLDPTRPHVKAQRGPDEMGLRHAPGRLRLGAVVLLCRSRSVATPRLTAMPLGDAVMELSSQVSGLAGLDAPLDVLAGILERSGGAFRLDYSDIAAATPVLEGLLGRRDPPARDVPARRLQASPAVPRVAEPVGSGVLRPHAWVDAIDTDDQLVVFDGRRPVLVEGLARMVWLIAAERDLSPAQVHQRAVELLGPHPDSVGLVRAAVSALVSGGLVDASGTDPGAGLTPGAGP